MYYQLINRLFNGVWAMSPEHIQGYLPLLASILKGEKLPGADWATGREAAKPKNQTYMYNPKTGRYYEYDSYLLKGEGMRIRVFTINDVITKYDAYCGPVGTTTLANYMKIADRDEEIDAVMLEIDSPGGDASFTKDLADVISAMNKPVLANVSGLCASAAYWIASACTEIWASQPTDIIGSIGTMITLADFKSYYEEQGLKIHDIYASASVDKNKDFEEAFKGNYKPIREGLLDPFNESFINSIKELRGGKVSEDAFSGKTFDAKTALEKGLIDGIGNRDIVLSRLKYLIDNNISGNKTDTSMEFKNTLIAKVLGMNDTDKTKSEEEQFMAELKQLKTENETQAATIARMKTENEVLKTEVENHKTQLEAEQENSKEWQAKFNLAQAEKSPVITKENDNVDEKEKVDTSLKHYQTLKEMGLE